MWKADSLFMLAPEIVLGAGLLAVFFVCLEDSAIKAARRVALTTAFFVVAACLLTLHANALFCFETYQVNLFSQLFKLVIACGLTGLLIFGSDLKDTPANVKPEYLFFLLTGTLGLLFLVSSVELITLLVALELSSFAMYFLIPLRQNVPGFRIHVESAIKYVVFGVATTGLMLWGMSYIFGWTGTTYLAKMAPLLNASANPPIVIIGMTLMLIGVFFKLAVFPFHSWLPDVYEGASNEAAAALSAIPKVGALAVFIRFALLVTPQDKALVYLLMVLSTASMFYGNLTALVQKDLKRMLGYSSIAHAGYVLLGFLALGRNGYALAMYYMFGFVAMYLAAFLVVCSVSAKGENLRIEDLSGLHKRSPLLALTLAVAMFALAGIPPFVGFMGKFLLFTTVWGAGFRVMVILAAINTALSIYYYLSVVRVAYLNEPGEQPAPVVGLASRALCIALIALIVVMGLLPGSLIKAATHSLQVMP